MVVALSKLILAVRSWQGTWNLGRKPKKVECPQGLCSSDFLMFDFLMRCKVVLLVAATVWPGLSSHSLPCGGFAPNSDRQGGGHWHSGCQGISCYIRLVHNRHPSAYQRHISSLTVTYQISYS